MSEGVIRAWRLSKARTAGDLTGQRAARDGQRWNQPGQRAVYLGMTPELTVLEVLVPQARNLLLHPLHPAMAQVALVHQEPFQLDQRLG